MDKNAVRAAQVLMISLVVARGVYFMLSKTLLVEMGPLTLLGIRFLLAFLVLFVVFFKRVITEIQKDKEILSASLALGAAYFTCMTCELIGLQYTSSSTCAFLENSAIVIVPILEAVLIRKFPSLKVILSCAITSIGIGMITLSGGIQSFGLGEFLCCIAAFAFASAIILNDRCTRRHDAFSIGIVHVGFIGIAALLAAFIFEAPHLPQTGTQWMMLLMLTLICTCLGFTLQPVAQKKISAQTAGVMFGLNPLTAAICGWIFMKEAMTPIGIIGGILIIIGIIATSLRPDG